MRSSICTEPRTRVRGYEGLIRTANPRARLPTVTRFRALSVAPRSVRRDAPPAPVLFLPAPSVYADETVTASGFSAPALRPRAGRVRPCVNPRAPTQTCATRAVATARHTQGTNTP